MHLNNLISNISFVDTWRNENPTQKTFTWSQTSPTVKCRLDYFLVPSQFVPRVEKTTIITCIKTDHKGVELQVSIDKYKRGPGLWKFNSEVLYNEKFVRDIRQLINKTWEEQSTEDLATRFDFLKYKVRQVTQKFCKSIAKERKLKEKTDFRNRDSRPATTTTSGLNRPTKKDTTRKTV